MSLLRSFWRKICEPLDGFLWHKNIAHPIIRTILRNQILASGAALIFGAGLWVAFPWLFWFGIGLTAMAWIFWSWARFFFNTNLAEYSSAFLRAVLLRFGLRFLLFAVGLFMALAFLHASAVAITAGLIAGGVLALACLIYNNGATG